MRNISLSLFFLCYSILAIAQQNPIHWSFGVSKVSETEFDLISTAKIDKKWHLYSQFLKGDGPTPTEFNFKSSPSYQLVGKTAEISDHKKSGFDKLFDMDVTSFEESVSFVQRVKVLDRSKPITGMVRYGTCDDEKCLPPAEDDFAFRLPAAENVVPFPSPQPAAVPANTSQPTNTPQPSKIGGGVFPQTASTIPATTSNPATTSTDPTLVAAEGASRNAQPTPVKWSFSSKKISETEYDLISKATIEKGWHVYSQFLKPDGPVPTSFKFDKDSNFELVGKAKEESPKRREHKEPLFQNMSLVDFEDSVKFIQRIKIKDPKKTFKGSLEFMCCNAVTCNPPSEVNFNINLASGVIEPILPTNELPGLSPVSTTSDRLYDTTLFDHTGESTVCNGVSIVEKPKSLWLIFVLGFFGGLFALLTPCVFPMIPLTVGYFTKSSKDKKTGIRNALIYGLSIIIIYVTLGILVTLIMGSTGLNQLATNAPINILFGILFLIFAVSFFGYFEITLPSSWTNKTDQAADKGGLLGIFFMAATLALVSFSCTGPIIGSLLVSTSTDGISAGPIAGMLGFATALALPFGLFAAFPAWLQALPKSGSWMTSVKVTLAFIEIALAFKFLSVADLTMHWKLLPYELVLGVWVLCALGLALYWAGFIRFAHDSKVKDYKPGRILMILISSLITVYLALGFRYSPQSGTFLTPPAGSGLLPPPGYSYIYPKACPLNLNCFHDFEEGLAVAKATNKPMLVDFTGYGCVNCRKEEDQVWSQPEVLKIINDDYVLISLYTDDRTELAQPFISKVDGKTKHNIGQKWAEFEITHFKRISQPYYVLVSPDLKILNQPIGYTPDVKLYKEFLECGKSTFKRLEKK
jgi:thiol:disulfide interchange protein